MPPQVRSLDVGAFLKNFEFFVRVALKKPRRGPITKTRLARARQKNGTTGATPVTQSLRVSKEKAGLPV